MGPWAQLAIGTINLTLLGPGLGPEGGPWDPNGTGPWDPGAHQTPNPNPNPKTHAWHDKPHILYVWALGPPKGALAPGPIGPNTKPLHNSTRSWPASGVIPVEVVAIPCTSMYNRFLR